MTSATPITAPQFALAIADLPTDTLHAKAAEIANAMHHLRHSNGEMQAWADAGDRECADAIAENGRVLARMGERMALLRGEVEGRGLVCGGWGEEGDGGRGGGVNGGVGGEGPARSGRLTDEELRRQVEARMDGEEEGEGVHL